MLDNRFPWQCEKVLPTVFADSLSYYEVLCKLYYMVEAIQVNIDTLLSQANSYTDERIVALNSEIQTQIKEIYSYVDSVALKLSETEKQDIANVVEMIANLEIEAQRQKIELVRLMDIKDNVVLSKCENLINQLYVYIENVVKLLPVYNPFYSGKSTSIQKYINDAYENTRTNPLTSLDYENIKITAKNYDDKFITARDYDFDSKNILVGCLFFSPFTGKPTAPQIIINEIAQALRVNSINAQTYDSYHLSTSAFDGKNISAYYYDWNAKNLLP